MNYAANTERWQIGDIVLHDADAKREEMLMIVRGYDRRTGECITNYCRTGYIAGMEKQYKNDVTFLHDPARFGLQVKRREASADPHLRDLDLSELGISPEQAARFDLIVIKQDAIAREDAMWLEAEQRS